MRRWRWLWRRWWQQKQQQHQPTEWIGSSKTGCQANCSTEGTQNQMFNRSIVLNVTQWHSWRVSGIFWKRSISLIVSFDHIHIHTHKHTQAAHTLHGIDLRFASKMKWNAKFRFFISHQNPFGSFVFRMVFSTDDSFQISKLNIDWFSNCFFRSTLQPIPIDSIKYRAISIDFVTFTGSFVSKFKFYRLIISSKRRLCRIATKCFS